MVVKHNIVAMNSNRMLSAISKAQAQSTEKLSSGYKINRAADDAAGLSISEKMRKQIRGLTQAAANAQDGISAVQTAEGALTEVHDMLQRMNELAVKSANGTNSKDDRDYIQAEVDQLVTEIERVSTTTKFNETYLLKGTDSTGKAGGSTYASAESEMKYAIATTGNITIDSDGNGTISFAQKGSTPEYSTSLADPVDKVSGYGNKHFVTYTFGDSAANRESYYYIFELDASTKSDGTKERAAREANRAAGEEVYFASPDALLAKIKDTYGETFSTLTFDETTKEIKFTAFADENSALKFDLHVGADSTGDNKISVSIKNLNARGLGINGIRVNGEDDSEATKSIDTIAKAIRTVSSQRSALGAVQNRLEHTIRNLDNVVENTTSAEAAIRDTDMATEMVRYSNNRILAQAGQAMLAQSNQSNQGVLALLG